MPAFDFKGLLVGEYKNDAGTVTYGTPLSMGEAMNCNLELSYAEGRLYAIGALREYKRMPTGGTISVGVKYIPDEAQKLMFGASEKSRTVGSTSAKSLVTSSSNIPVYVGIGGWAPDVIDGVDKVSAFFVHKALFGAPGLSYETKGQSLTFQTPTTTGEFMPSDASGEAIIETAILNSEADAEAWVKACMKG